MMLGRVDEVDGHFIATKFVAGVIPTKSLYITGKAAPRMTRFLMVSSSIAW